MSLLGEASPDTLKKLVYQVRMLSAESNGKPKQKNDSDPRLPLESSKELVKVPITGLMPINLIRASVVDPGISNF